jgi:hypothetical protein
VRAPWLARVSNVRGWGGPPTYTGGKFWEWLVAHLLFGSGFSFSFSFGFREPLSRFLPEFGGTKLSSTGKDSRVAHVWGSYICSALAGGSSSNV